MKKYFLALLSVIVLLFTACDSWMQDDDFYSEIENDVKVANAQQINVYVRYALTRQGKTDPDGYATFKVEIPHEISATTEPEYGFVRWAAFPTSFLATGDNQAKNKDVYFIDDEDYKTRLLPYEIQSPVVVFENDKSATTKVTINEKRDDIFLVPIVAQRPAVSLTIPAKGSSGVVRNMSVRINFTKPMDPESFKNEAGEYDKITITQGIQTFSTDGDIEITSEDITDRFQEPLFSANKKMVTLRFTQEAISEGYSSQSSVNIIISKDVKDVFGFNMTDDDKISFSVGSSMDTLAPRITRLTAGTALTNFDSFKGMYKDAATWNLISAVTQMESWQQGSGTNATYLGASSAPANNLDSSFYDTFAPPADASNSGYRVTNKLYIHALAEDIAGSGSNQSQTGIETDVAMLGVRATLMYAADGSVPETPVTLPTSSVNYMPQSVGQSLAKDYVYKNLVHAINVQNGAPNASDPGFIAEDKGFLFEYDLSSLPDGLIRVDVFAVDMVQNSGLSAGGELSEEYGNGYASLFVVKDTTPPDAAVNAGHVNVDTSASTLITADNYFNEKTYKNLRIKSDESSIIDSGHPRLRSHHDAMKWIVKPTESTDWVSTVKTSDSAWGAITANYGPFPNPGNEGQVHYTYALMDDVGNISAAVGINPIYYDSVAPAVGQLTFKADAGYTDGVAKDNILDEQTLIIPIKEITSGLKSIEVKVRKNGATEDYATPLANSGLVVTTGGEAVSYTIDSGKKIITFSQPQTNFDSTVSIKGLKLSDDLDEQGSFEVSVLVKDAAAADSVHETLPAEAAVSNTDSVAVEINQIYIPNVRKTERLGATGFEYWIDYNASTLTKKANSNPLTDVFITFKEATSGAKVFDFTGSSIKLTESSSIYKINATTGAIDGIAIPSAVSGNKLTITSSVDAKNNFANPSDENKVTVKITNVELADEDSASSVALKIYDTATNPSAAGTTICSNEGSLNLINPGISTAGFKFDSAAPTAAMTHGSLADSNSDEAASTATEAIGKTAAETGYTNENYINASLTLNPKASGIASLRIAGDAVFDSTTTIKANGNNVEFDISASGKVVTFKQGSAHVVLGSGTTAVSLAISNLKLTSGDGMKTVTILASSFGNVEDSEGASDYIVLDTEAPNWNGNGLYVATNSYVTSGYVYPHPASNENAYGLTGIDSTKPEELYFYRQSKISIKPDVSDSGNNLKDAASLIDYTHDGASVVNNNAAYSPDSSYGYTTQTGTFTATAKDKAGNKSTVKTFHIVENAPFTSDENSALNNYMVLYKPEGAFIHRNSSASAGLIKYVIKGNADYQIRVKLTGVAIDSGEESITGSTTTIPSAYGRTKNTTTSPKIEKFYISTDSSYDTSDTEISSPSYNSTYWKSYSAGTYNFAALSSDVVVDDSGTIVINLPHEDCDPIVLHLMDGCGNTTCRRIRPTSMISTSNAIFWSVDSKLGESTSNAGTADYSYPTTIKTTSDVTFYNSTATLTLSNCSDSCRFDDSGTSTESDLANGRYTMKSRILLWPTTKSGEPNQLDFHNESETLTPWVGVKEAQPSSTNTAFNLVNNYPMLESSTPYKLYYIIEDTVGNNRVEKITRNDSNGYARDLWLFDNTKPVITNVQTAENINTIDGKNYYSNKSTVTYTVSDEHSGIMNDGRHSDFTYTSFANRKTSQSITYELDGKSPSSSEKLVIPSTSVKDWAGNGLTADVELSYGDTDKWVRMASSPAWYSGTYLSVANGLNTDWGLSTSTDTETSCIAYKIKSKAYNSQINVSFKVNDSDLLGWIITDEDPLSDTEIAAFCAKNDSRLKILTHTDSSNWYTYTFEKKYNNGFADRYTAWLEKYNKPKYFYPVNKAGLICSNPVRVEFQENLIPAISDNGVHYDTYVAPTSDVPFPITGKITAYGSDDDAVNYTKSGAAIKFSTVNTPDICWIIYGAGSDNEFGTDDDAHINFTLSDYLNTDDDSSTYKYKIPLDYQTIRDLPAGTLLKLRLSTESEDSVVTDLTGPANNNKWTFDETAPAIKFTTSDVKSGKETGSDTVAAKSVKFTSSSESDRDTTLYIQSGTAKINLSIVASESSTSAASDIAHYQWKKGSADWKDIKDDTTATLTVDGASAVLSFPAPEAKTSYQFRVIDKAGNISQTHEFSTTSGVKINEVTLQRDEWAPEGDFAYTTNKDGSSVDLQSATVGLDVDYKYVDEQGTTVTDSETRDIKYSSAPDGEYYINKIVLDLSAITNLNDKHGSFDRAGIKGYQLIEDGGEPVSIPASTTSYPITLHNDSNSVGNVFEYELKVIDNLNQSRTLKKFRTQADNQAPALDDRIIQATNADGSSAYAAKLYNDVYYLRNDKAVITFTIDDDNADYFWSNDGSEWKTTNISKEFPVVTYTFDAPDSEKTYYFMAKDKVGNPTTTTGLVLRKDAAKPTGEFTYKLKKSGGYATTADGIYTDSGESTTRTIVYKAGTVTGLELDFSNLSDAISGIEGYYLKEGEHNPVALTSTTTPSLGETDKLATITLATGDNVTKTYVVSVKDNAGNERTLQTITITSDAAKPDFSLATSNIVTTDEGGTVYQSGTTPYYINGTNAIISFTKTDADSDIRRYEWKTSDVASWSEMKTNSDASIVFTEDGNNITFQFPASVDETTYNFRAVDNVGNESDTVSVSLVKDVTAPALKEGKTALSFAVLNASDSDATPVSDTVPVADYILTAEGTTVTITYNPNVVKTISFNNLSTELNEYETDGANSGFARLYYKSATGDPHDMDSDNDGVNEISLSNEWTNKSYTIHAADKAGNQSAALMTIVFNADGTGPELELAEDKVNSTTWNGRTVKQVKGYTSVYGTDIQYDIPYAKWIKKDDRQRANVYRPGTKLKYAKSEITGAVQYQLVQTVTTTSGEGSGSKDNDGYTATAGATWNDMTVEGNDYVFALPAGENAIHTPYTRLSLFFRDSLGNVSGPYFLGNNAIVNGQSQIGIQWWIEASPLSAENITINSVTYNNGTGSGWNTESPQQDYTVKVLLPVGTIIKSVFLAPKPNGANTGVVFSTGTALFTLSGYTSTQTDIIKEPASGKYDSEGYIVLPSAEGSTTGELCMNIYPHTSVTNSADVLVKFNGANADEEGVSKQIFAANGNFNIRTLFGGRNSSSDEGTGARVTQLFNSVANVFARNSEVTADTSVTEKPADVAKKATKKAKKTAKKAGKKASGKAVAAEKPLMAVETAEILEQTLTTNAPEITGATESVVNEIAQITENVQGQSEVITRLAPAASADTESQAENQTVAEAETDAGGKKSSKSSIIVIMLAFLSSFGGVWYYQKGRKL